jgi:hypothetical protein
VVAESRGQKVCQQRTMRVPPARRARFICHLRIRSANLAPKNVTGIGTLANSASPQLRAGMIAKIVRKASLRVELCAASATIVLPERGYRQDRDEEECEIARPSSLNTRLACSAHGTKKVSIRVIPIPRAEAHDYHCCLTTTMPMRANKGKWWILARLQSEVNHCQDAAVAPRLEKALGSNPLGRTMRWHFTVSGSRIQPAAARARPRWDDTKCFRHVLTDSTPFYRVSQRSRCTVLGDVRVAGYSDVSIPWPVTRRGEWRVPIV